MGFTIIECAQRSPEWFAARLGRVTSTGAVDMLSKGRGKEESSARRNLRVRLALEQITGRSCEPAVFQTQAMRDGVEREPDAAAAYEALTRDWLTPTGFLAHDTLMAGCSLDGHVGQFTGIVELKSPIEATHLEYLRSGVVPTDYMRQVTHALYVTGAEWCDWLSFQPSFPEHLRVKLVRVTRASIDMAQYERDLIQFLAEVSIEKEAIETMANPAAQLTRAAEAAGA